MDILTEFQTIRVATDGEICRVNLARPEKLNSFNRQMMTELKLVFRQIQSSTELRLVVVSGDGRAFCTGQDLEERRIPEGEKKPDLGESLRQNYNQLMMIIRQLSIPVIAAVKGVAAGAGASFALGCDLVIAQSSARFIFPFTNLGLIPDSGSTANLMHSLGQARAIGIALLGEEMTADEAVRAGLIWASIDEAEFDEYMRKIETRIISRPALGLSLVKRSMYQALDQSYEQQLKTESECQSIAGQNPMYWTKVLQFLNKGKS